jgi:hypothetical protein
MSQQDKGATPSTRDTEKRIPPQRCSESTGWMPVSSMIIVSSMATPFLIFYALNLR